MWRANHERGVITGKLEKELLYTQEVAFVEQIHNLVRNNNYLSFLGWFTRVFNRHLDETFPEENKLETYGESFSAPHEFDFINPAYDRMLNYHAAHDIGHALQSLALVGCTSFAAWDERSADSSMIIGRNLDFYLGDKFSQDKIVYFCNPKQGNKFAMITWAGFMGCVSGMNEKGITVTINAAKRDVQNGATTPISILAREILQYAARRRGWAVDDGYFSSGVMAVAAPVCDQSGNIAFAVSAVMFLGKRSEAEIQIIGEALRDLGHRLETVLFEVRRQRPRSADRFRSIPPASFARSSDCAAAPCTTAADPLAAPGSDRAADPDLP